MRRIFWGFCRNWFLMSPLHYLLSRSDFGFEFVEIFGFEKRTPCYHQYGESPTPRISDAGIRQLPASLIIKVGDSPASPLRRVRYWILKINYDTESRRLPAPVIQWVADSLYHWVGKSSTPRITDSESRRLRISLSHGVDDSACQWYRELVY